MIGGTVECAKEQTISCATDWKALVPLARTEPLYHELKESHGTYEGVHDYWRDRYKVAADELGIRPKVVSRDWHRLRANVACLIDWLRIAAKNGWLGSTRAAQRHAGERRFKERGERISSRLAKMRMRMGLAQPYGAKAVKLGLGELHPPSRRARGAPPGSPSRARRSSLRLEAAPGHSPGRLPRDQRRSRESPARPSRTRVQIA